MKNIFVIALLLLISGCSSTYFKPIEMHIHESKAPIMDKYWELMKKADSCWSRTATPLKNGIIVEPQVRGKHKTIDVRRYNARMYQTPFVMLKFDEPNNKIVVLEDENALKKYKGYWKTAVNWINGDKSCGKNL